MADAPVLWSSEQHAWLGAMGLTVYAEASTIAWPPAPAARPAPAFENLTPAVVAPPRRAAPMADSEVAASAPRRVPVSAPVPAPSLDTPAARPPRRSAGRIAGMPDRLMLALLRASGQNPNDPATQALMASWPLDELRANPASKRALWPQLRALRRQRNPH